MSSEVKVALAGIAGYGDAYLAALLPNERAMGIRLVGVVDTAPQRCRRLQELSVRRIPIHNNLAGLFNDTAVDLMLIVTPMHFHTPQTCFALQHGASVLCEKPVAGTITDGLKMLAAQRSAKGFIAIGYQWSFSHAVQALKRDIIAGVFGRPIRMKALAFFPRPMSYFRRNDWAGRMRTADGDGVYDSPVNNATAHYLHNMFYILGPTPDESAMPASVQAELYRANQIENYDTAAIRCRTECGAEILFYTTHAVPERRGPQARYEFERAIVEYDAADAQFIARFRDGRITCYGGPNFDRHEKIWQSVEAVRTSKPVVCGVKAALAHAFCAAAAQASMPNIGNFPERLRLNLPFDGERMVCIDGLQSALTECYERELLPSDDARLEWAQRGEVIELDPPLWPQPHHPPIPVHA